MLEGQHDQKSTVTNLINLIDRIIQAWGDQHQKDVIYTDFTKSFKRMNYKILA